MDKSSNFLSMKKLIFLYTHPIQYFAPLQASIEAAKICEPMVLFCEDTTKGYFDKEFGKDISWDIPLLAGYQNSFLPKSTIARLGHFCRYSNFSVHKWINKEKTDVLIVHGWSYCTAVYAILLAKLSGIKIWLRSESPYHQELKKSMLNRWLKQLFFRFFFFKLVDKFLYIGKENRLFYDYYGVPHSKLIFAPYCVDNDRLGAQSAGLENNRIVREQLGLSEEAFVVLFSGKLIDKKNPMHLLKAFHMANIENSVLIFLGDGALANELQTFVDNNRITNVIFAGFKNQSELPVYYHAADLFVLPSGLGETWGLVVNEAMNFSLPIIVSDEVGCAADLVLEGQNGFTYPLGNIDILAELLKKVSGDKAWREQAGAISKDLIQQYNYATIIENLSRAL